MKAIAVVTRGIEKTAQSEILELINQQSETFDNFLIFDFNSDEELCKLCYLGQSFTYIGKLLSSGKFTELDEITLSDTFLNEYNGKIKFQCTRIGIHDFTSTLAQETIAKKILKGKTVTVDLKSPDVIFHILIVDNFYYIFLDYSGKNLSKREYKIFNHPSSINASIAYHLIKLSGIKSKDSFLDPFCGGGTIPIEAALYFSKKSPWYYKKDFLFLKFLKLDFEKLFDKWDKLKSKEITIFASDSSQNSVMSSEKNAKIAGIKDLISFSRIDVDWLDLKFENNKVDYIITHAPFITSRIPEKKIRDTFSYLIREMQYILKGKLIILLKDDVVFIEELNKNNRTLLARHEFLIGNEMHYILICS